MSKIPEAEIKRIVDSVDLQGLIEESVPLKRSGDSREGKCPHCNGGKLSMSKAKNLWKCFGCDRKGDVIKWVQELHNLSYPQAIEWLANKGGLILHTDKKTKGHGLKTTFRDDQLLQSGIDNKSQTSLVKDGNKSIEIDRYQRGTVISGEITDGDDMILHYVNLEREYMTYTNSHKKGNKKERFFRVRYSNPSRAPKDENGKPAKYRSPSGGGNMLWMPEYIINAYEGGHQLGTLVVVEGEKKADNLCINGQPAVGVAGIHNFKKTGTMPNEFVLLIRKCGIKAVVFMLDADCMDLSFNSENIDSRPRTFASAVGKFFDYFDGYKIDGIILKIFVTYHKDSQHKGIDDLMYRHPAKKDREKIIDDLSNTLADVKYQSEIWATTKLDDMNIHKIQSMWHVNNVIEFIDHYQQTILDSGLDQVKIRGRFFSVEDGKIEEINKMRDWEQYWIDESWETKDGRKVRKFRYDYLQINDFLKSHGFGRMEIGILQKFVKVESNIIHEMQPVNIKDFVIQYTHDLSLEMAIKKEILRMLLQASDQYFGESKLKNMYMLSEQLYEPSPKEQLLIFKTKFWRITENEIKEFPLAELPGKVWKNKQINWDVELIPDSVNVGMKDQKFTLEVNPDIQKSDMWRYLWGTSNFYWRDEYEEHTDPETGIMSFKFTKPQADREKYQDIIDNLIPKLIAMGYLSTDYINYAQLKAIICMDNAESAVGMSKGGSGKSVFGSQFLQWKPTHRIDGKKKDLETDQFLYDGVDERTELLYFDDCRVNMDFENWFSQITGGLTVNSKGLKRQNLTPRKMIFNTNHSLWGRDDSTRRRQYVITFSDYYNLHRTPFTEFGKNMFWEWEYNDWNYYFNILACSIQLNLRFGLTYTIPGGDVVRRGMRQLIGEDFIDWADDYFYAETENAEDKKMDKKVPLMEALTHFLTQFPKQRNYVDKKKFREKLKVWCTYMGYVFNPPSVANKDGRIRSGSVESFYISTNPDKDIITQDLGSTPDATDDDTPF